MVNALREDRDGTIWVAGHCGIRRFLNGQLSEEKSLASSSRSRFASATGWKGSITTGSRQVRAAPLMTRTSRRASTFSKSWPPTATACGTPKADPCASSRSRRFIKPGGSWRSPRWASAQPQVTSPTTTCTTCRGGAVPLYAFLPVSPMRPVVLLFLRRRSRRCGPTADLVIHWARE